MLEHERGSTNGQLGLRSWSFAGLVAMQFLTVVNDNVFRWLVVGIGKQFVDREQVQFVLTAGMFSFVLPYLLLAAPSGYLADRYSKRAVIVRCKFAEIVLMAAALLAIWLGNIYLIFIVLALLGAQSCLFSPARLGAIPEMLRSDAISAANGLMGLTTVVGTVLGAAVGNVLTDVTRPRGQHQLGLSASVLIGIAVSGFLASLLIARAPAADASRRFPWNPLPRMIADFRILAAHRAMLRVALGSMFFWSLGSLANMNIDQYVFEGNLSASAAENQSLVAPLLACLALGVGIGSVLAGIWSAGRVELGLLPVGGMAIATGSIAMDFVQGALVDTASAVTPSYLAACAFLIVLGIGGGMFDVPLQSYLQHRSPPASRGSILAASNFLTFSGVLLFSALFCLMRYPTGPAGEPLLTTKQVFLVAGVVTIPVCVYIVWLIPQTTIRFLVWLASMTIYKVRVVGRENVPARGGALLVPNHVSYVDAMLLLLTSSRPIRVIAWAGNFQNRVLGTLGRLFGAILVDPSRPKSIVAALREARDAVAAGELVCIFPEGGISRSGQLLAFRPGMLRILEGNSVPVIPVYLDGLWGSIFSFERGRFFWKWPKQIPYRMSIYFGAPIYAPDDVHRVRQGVQELGARAVDERSRGTSQLVADFVGMCRRRGNGLKVADSTGAELTGRQLLMRTLALRRALRREVLGDDERYVGVLLPPSAAGTVANVALAIDRRISANLNYTNTSETLNYCIAQAGIRHVLTSRKFMEKMEFKLDAEIVFLEDLRARISRSDKLVALAGTYLLPTKSLLWSLKMDRVSGDEVLTVIFTSGSTGRPKGVMLTFGNIGSNVSAIDQVVRLSSSDVLIGVLPFFHSFGYTVTMWAVLGLDVMGAYHFNPLDAKQVGKLCKKYRGTVLLSTPTFLRTYARRCEKEEFATLDVVVAGAEKLPLDVCDSFQQQFGVRPVEGYGTTELSPLVSVNVPPSRSAGAGQVDSKEGTVGRPVPGVSARITDPDTGAVLGVDQPGMLWIKGPNVMKGYLGQDDLTRQVIQDGWYNTGDIGLIDGDGFIRITGRLSRFSKIGGEMVPHILIEEEINKFLGAAGEGTLKAAVTAIPDAKKGERLVVVHLPIEKSPAEVQQALMAAGLPNIYIPSADSFIATDHLPILGSGKLDLAEVKKMALKLCGT
ncbi:MAG: MFS transporter [Planctomycetes bacterium]|nr:MFS transporter [Planctomycetota bacterium]